MLALVLTGISAATAEDGDMHYSTLHVPPNAFLSVPDKSQAKRKVVPRPGVVSLGGQESEGIYGVVEWLKRSGITFPQGSEATYVADRSLLISRNSKDNLEKIDVLLNSGAPRDQPASIRSEIVVATFHAPGELLDNPSLALSELKKIAGDSWREIAKLEILSKSGMNASASAINGETTQSGEAKTAKFPDGAWGSSCEIETILNPDGYSMDVDVWFRYRGRPDQNQPPLDLEYKGATTAWDGFPQFLQMIKGDKDTPASAVILRNTQVLPSSWPMNKAVKSAP